MNTQPTPETDAIVRNAAAADHPMTRLAATLTVKCEKLERERDELKAMLTKDQGVVTISRNGYVQELERERDEAREQRDKLAESILNLSHPNCVMLISERDHWKARFKMLNTELMCELRDPNGTIWDHAKTLQDQQDKLTIKCEQLEQQRNALCSFINREIGMSANDPRISELKRILENSQDQERP